jgi:hypothetical protein
MKSRELRARRAKLVEDARALAADRAFSKEDSIKFDRMMAESDRLKEQIDRIEVSTRGVPRGCKRQAAAA